MREEAWAPAGNLALHLPHLVIHGYVRRPQSFSRLIYRNSNLVTNILLRGLGCKCQDIVHTEYDWVCCGLN